MFGQEEKNFLDKSALIQTNVMFNNLCLHGRNILSRSALKKEHDGSSYMCHKNHILYFMYLG